MRKYVELSTNVVRLAKVISRVSCSALLLVLSHHTALLQRRRQFPIGKMENLIPCKIETLEQIDTQFVRIDYVQERNVSYKFGKKSVHGDFWAKGWNISFCVTPLFILFFSQTNTNVAKRPLDGFWCAMAQKDAESRNDRCAFLGL